MGLFIYLIISLIAFLWLFFKWTSDEPFYKMLWCFLSIASVLLLIHHAPAEITNFLK